MKWKLWRLGALVSIVLSLFVAMAGVAAGISWQGFVAVLGAALVTHFGAYVTQNPVKDIEFDGDPVAFRKNVEAAVDKEKEKEQQ